MDQYLSINNILDTIMDKLSVRQRFAIESVSRKWRLHARSSLSCHKRLLIVNQFKQFPADYESLCPHHKLYKTDLVGHKMTHMAFWERVLEAMPRLEVIYVGTPPDTSWCSMPTPIALLQLIMEKYHTTLKCLYAGYESFNGESGEENVFPFVASLPHLKHLFVKRPERNDMNALLTIAPMLEYLSFATIGRGDSKFDTRLFPKRLKGVVGAFYGLEGVCLSPASQTLECISNLRLEANTLVRICNFPKLQRLGVSIEYDEDPQKCVEVIANLVSNCPNLTQFQIMGYSNESFDEPSIKSWLTVLSCCPNVTEFDFSYGMDADEKSSNMFVQQMIQTMTGLKKLSLNMPIYWDGLIPLSKMTGLKELSLNMPIPSHGFIHLSNLDHLESLELTGHLATTSHDFDSESFLYFLETSLGKKLRNLDMSARIQVPTSFSDRVKDLCDTLNLKSNVSENQAKEGEACDPDYVIVTYMSVHDEVSSKTPD